MYSKSSQHSCLVERTSNRGCRSLAIGQLRTNCGSTNSKGLPVPFQGSHQDFLLNNQLTTTLRREPRACPWSLISRELLCAPASLPTEPHQAMPIHPPILHVLLYRRRHCDASIATDCVPSHGSHRRCQPSCSHKQIKPQSLNISRSSLLSISLHCQHQDVAQPATERPPTGSRQPMHTGPTPCTQTSLPNKPPVRDALGRRGRSCHCRQMLICSTMWLTV